MLGKLLTLALVVCIGWIALGKLRTKLGFKAPPPQPPFLSFGRFQLSRMGAMIAVFIALYLLIALVSIA